MYTYINKKNASPTSPINSRTADRKIQDQNQRERKKKEPTTQTNTGSPSLVIHHVHSPDKFLQWLIYIYIGVADLFHYIRISSIAIKPITSKTSVTNAMSIL